MTNIVTTLVGKRKPGSKDGKTSDALFNNPKGLGLLPDGSVLVTDNTESVKTRVRKISPDDTVSTCGKNTMLNLKGKNYKHVAVNKNGIVVLVDDQNCRIDTVSSNGRVCTLADLKPKGFDIVSLQGLTVDDEGNVFVSKYRFDKYNESSILQISPDGVVVTLAGGESWGFADGQGALAKFSDPHGLAVDANRNVFVADYGTRRIRKISPSGEVTTLAGNGHRGNDTGNGNSVCLNCPKGLAVDGDGNVIVADSGNHRILKITSDGFVSVLAGNGSEGYVDGPGSQARFNLPQDVVVDNKGNVLVSDMHNNCIRVIAAGLTPPRQSSAGCKGESSKPTVSIPTIVSRHLSNSKFSDVTVQVGKRSFPAHRMVLARCPFFEATFENECVESSTRKVVLKDMDADAFQRILEYLYTDKMDISAECDAFGLRSAAEFLGLSDLEKECEIAIQKRLCVDNLAKCYRYAMVNSMNTLKRQCVMVATESISTLVRVQMTKEYAETVEADSEMKQAFLKDCESFRK